MSEKIRNVKLIENDKVLSITEAKKDDGEHHYSIEDIKQQGKFIETLKPPPNFLPFQLSLHYSDFIREVYEFKGLEIMIHPALKEIVTVIDAETRDLLAMSESGRRGYERKYGEKFSLERANIVLRNNKGYGS